MHSCCRCLAQETHSRTMWLSVLYTTQQMRLCKWLEDQCLGTEKMCIQMNKILNKKICTILHYTGFMYYTALYCVYIYTHTVYTVCIYTHTVDLLPIHSKYTHTHIYRAYIHTQWVYHLPSLHMSTYIYIHLVGLSYTQSAYTYSESIICPVYIYVHTYIYTYSGSIIYPVCTCIHTHIHMYTYRWRIIYQVCTYIYIYSPIYTISLPSMYIYI